MVGLEQGGESGFGVVAPAAAEATIRGMGKRQVLRDKERMATEFTQDLEAELKECRVALQGQAQVMLDLLLQFETRLEERLAAAEARISALRTEPGPSSTQTLVRASSGDGRTMVSDHGYDGHSAAG